MEESGEITHLEFLHEENSDPAEALADQLAADIGETGSVLVYRATFDVDALRPEHHLACETRDVVRVETWCD